MMISRLQIGREIIVSSELVERICQNNGQIESIQEKNGALVVEAVFPDGNVFCPRCTGAQTRRFGWRKGKFTDQPTTDGIAVTLIARRPRVKCVGCGKAFLADPPYLAKYGRITLAMQRHLAQEILHFPSIRELAKAKRLSAKTVMSALKAALAETKIHQEAVDTLAVRSLNIGERTYWLGIDLRTLKTIILIEGREPSALKDLIVRIAGSSPNEVDLPINPELAALLKTALPNARLTLSIPEVYDLTDGILKEYIERFSYKLREEGLNSEQAQNLCSTPSDSLPLTEQLLFKQLSAKTTFWGAYQFKNFFHAQLKSDVSYRQAIQYSLVQATEAVRPLFLPVYRKLVQLDQLGIEIRRDQECEQLQLKLKRLKERLRKQGTRFEFPLLSAIIGLFLIGFGGPSLVGGFKQTLVEIHDLLWVPSSFWLSDVERRAILLA